MRTTRIIIFFTFLFQIALKGTILLTSLYALHLNASPAMIGVIIAIGSLFPMVFASIAGKLADRIPLNFLISISMFGAGLTLAVIFFTKDSLLILMFVQLIFGLFQITVVVSCQSCIGAISTKKNRTSNFAHYTLGVSIANLIGPAIVGLSIEMFSYQIAYIVLSFFAIVPAIYFCLNPIEQVENVKAGESIRFKTIELLKMKPLREVLITSGIILTGVGLFEFYFPIYTNSIGLSAGTIGLLVSTNGLAFIISRLLMGSMQNKWTVSQIIGGCLVLTACAFICLPFIQSLFGLAFISFVIGLGIGCCQPLSIVMAYDVAPSGSQGEVLGLRLTVNKTVQFFVPLVFGSIAFFGTLPIFGFTGLLLALQSRKLLMK